MMKRDFISLLGDGREKGGFFLVYVKDFWSVRIGFHNLFPTRTWKEKRHPTSIRGVGRICMSFHCVWSRSAWSCSSWTETLSGRGSASRTALSRGIGRMELLGSRSNRLQHASLHHPIRNENERKQSTPLHKNTGWIWHSHSWTLSPSASHSIHFHFFHKNPSCFLPSISI